jgi:hypothetical protein
LVSERSIYRAAFETPGVGAVTRHSRHGANAQSCVVLVDPVWVPANEFIRIVREHASGTPEDSDSIEGTVVRVMDPRRDAALYFASKTPDHEGTFFTRFIVTHDGSVPTH